MAIRQVRSGPRKSMIARTRRERQESGRREGERVAVAQEYVLPIEVEAQAPRAPDARVRFKIRSHAVFMVPLDEIDGARKGRVAQGVDDLPVEGVNVAVIAVVKFEEIAEDDDYVRVLRHLPQECLDRA